MKEMFLIGTTVGLVIILIFIDYFGRKLSILISLIFTIISIFMIIVF